MLRSGHSICFVLFPANEPCRSVRASLCGQVHSSLLADSRLLPQHGRSSAPEGDRGTQWPAKNNGVPTPLHDDVVRDGGQGGEKSLSNPDPPAKKQAVPAWVCCSRSTVAVFYDSFGQL